MMTGKPNGEAKVPDFVDEVDSLDDFQDACVTAAEMAAFAAAHPRPAPQPREPASDGRIPTFVSVVDSLEVFIDTPLPAASKVEPQNVTATPAPTAPADPQNAGAHSS
jgi:hypothetical protein